MILVMDFIISYILSPHWCHYFGLLANLGQSDTLKWLKHESNVIKPTTVRNTPCRQSIPRKQPNESGRIIEPQD
jgi:hypothetical protein